MKFVTQDYYEILNVSPGATNEEVKRAYRLVHQSFRPDSMAIHSLYAPEETEAISAKIDEAFRILSDAELARRYAKYHRSGGPGTEVPRDPDVFFDQVHDLDGPSPIEQLARQVGRLSEVRRKVDRVAEEPVPVALRSIPPEPRFNPSPVSSKALPAVSATLPESPSVLGDAMDTSLEGSEPISMPAPPDSLFDEPISVRAAVLLDIDTHGGEDDIEPLSVLAAVSVDDDDKALASLEDEALANHPVESLPSSAFLSLLDTESTGPASHRPSGGGPRVARTMVDPNRPAASSVDPSTRPLPGAQVSQPQAKVPVRVEATPPVTRPFPEPRVKPVMPSRPIVTPTPSMAPFAGTTPSPPPVASTVPSMASVAPTVPSMAPVAPTVPSMAPVAGTGPSMTSLGVTVPSVSPVAVTAVSVQPVVGAPRPGPPKGPASSSTPLAGSLAFSRRPMAPRRWDRASIRTRAVGPLDVVQLSRDVLESIEMDHGGMNGAFLQTVRRELDVAIKDISERTKISVMMLRYIEADDVAELPAKVYLKGYLTQVARLLKLPAKEFVSAYLKVNGIP